jgi:hypothetical protein
MASRLMAFVIPLLLIGSVASNPVDASPICLEDTSGAVYNIELVEGTTLLYGTIEVPGACPRGPLSGSWAISDTAGRYEIGFWVHYNTLSTGCVAQISFSGTVDGSLNGEGILTFVSGVTNTVLSGAVTIGPCGSVYAPTSLDRTSSEPWFWWKD